MAILNFETNQNPLRGSSRAPLESELRKGGKNQNAIKTDFFLLDMMCYA